MRETLVGHPGLVGGKILVVWTKMLIGDDLLAATRSSEVFPPSAATQYWDEDRVFGRHLAAALGMSVEIAWDVYVFLQAGQRWEANDSLQPYDWGHQLSNADQDRFRSGAELAAYLRQAADRILRD